jgi:hypothetical protein
MTASALWVAFGAGMLAGIYVYALWFEPLPLAEEDEPVYVSRHLRQYRREIKRLKKALAAAKARGTMPSMSSERSEEEES